jgi:predicted dehydrogenase/threonine dehydrogenase-like Zn-dependent dehydrogenase
MLQLTQNLKTGKMELSEVPTPSLDANSVIVRNHNSLISAGTEGSMVSVARKGYIGKAKEKPEQVKQVLETVKREGIVNTYKKVMTKLDALNPLGYSTAGVVTEVGENIKGIRVGDRVACAGAGMANHAEVISVTENLIAKIPDNVSFKEAAYTTVCAIAMQGVRQADLSLGENCLVIGMGLIGQITAQLLEASGVRVIGTDLSDKILEEAKKVCNGLLINSSDAQLEQAVLNATDGYGADAVIITAGTSSLGPIETAGKLSRTKGTVVIVGAVPTGFSRENFYKKELELKMSCSYGPGRYNANYEEKGLDYPIAYVRWTENRNMRSVLHLMSQGKLNVKDLTTHEFDFTKAIDAYQMIVDKSDFFLGILLQYDTEKDHKPIFEKERMIGKTDQLGISYIGAGSFAQSLLLPNMGNLPLRTIATKSGHTAKNIANKFNFSSSTCNADDVIDDENTNVVFITTRHALHAEFVLKAIKNGKHVFVEKPLCLTREELEEIKTEYQKQNIHLMVGFNRRFAPLIAEQKKLIDSERPKAINYRINAGYIPADHWTQDRSVGGGRILGEVCHFIDLAMFIAGSLPESLSANTMEDPQGLMDTLNVNIRFKNGSIANVSYFANGSKAMSKEYLEVFSNGISVVINDFKSMDIYGNKKSNKKLLNQDKGHKLEIKTFLDSVKSGGATPISFEEIYYSTLMSFDIIDSIKARKTILY